MATELSFTLQIFSCLKTVAGEEDNDTVEDGVNQR